YVADTGNDRLRTVGADGQVSTIGLYTPEGAEIYVGGPVGVSATRDGFLYFTEQERGRIWQLAPDGRTRLVAGTGPGFADGDGATVARMNQPAGLALDRRGALYVADGANYLVRKLAPADDSTTRAAETSRPTPAQAPPTADASAPPADIPRFTTAILGMGELPWPLDPQNRRHEVTATLGEVRGSYDSADPRHHLHSGIDVFGPLGATVRAVYEEKVTGPAAGWGFDALHEGFRAGLFAYIHIRVGRGGDGKMFDDPRFIPVRDEAGKITRVRVRRGARFRAGDAVGTVNRMYHVHLNFGPPDNERNPLALPFVGFADGRAPLIARDGVRLFDASGAQLSVRRDGRLEVRGPMRIVVEAYDQVDGNAARRRIGLYRLGYQILKSDETPAEGFAAPRVTLEFDRLPPRQDAVKLAYAGESGITVYGSKETRFFYEVTNTVRRGEAREGSWNSAELPAGDYTLRVFAADFAGNVATADVPVRIVRD
ncbi:MAG: gluconolaconase, partial [Acidobacteria bacterium]|nr:gluconolaconase [Acidobacteriota bacterium]